MPDSSWSCLIQSVFALFFVSLVLAMVQGAALPRYADWAFRVGVPVLRASLGHAGPLATAFSEQEIDTENGRFRLVTPSEVRFLTEHRSYAARRLSPLHVCGTITIDGAQLRVLGMLPFLDIFPLIAWSLFPISILLLGLERGWGGADFYLAMGAFLLFPLGIMIAGIRDEIRRARTALSEFILTLNTSA